MKIIEVDEELYQFIASKTQSIGESASDILRRLLDLPRNNAYQLASLSESQPASESEISFTENGKPNVTPAPQAAAPAETKAESIEEAIKPTKKQSDEVMQKTISKLQALLDSSEFQQENKAVVRFLNILTILYRTNPEGFAQATESLQGRTRVYFARDEGTLLMAGNHTKPKQIPDTPYWVITNTNSGRKMLMLEGAMQSMHLPEALIDQVRVFFVAN